LRDLKAPKPESSIKKTATDLALALLHVNLISKDNKWEVPRIMWARLDEEFIPPAVEGLK
jgi:hypothetical protein